MIEAQARRLLKWFTAKPRRRGQQDLLLEADVPEEPAPKLIVRGELRGRAAFAATLEQRVEAPVILGEELA
jgi:hypothetical protein